MFLQIWQSICTLKLALKNHTLQHTIMDFAWFILANLKSFIWLASNPWNHNWSWGRSNLIKFELKRERVKRWKQSLIRGAWFFKYLNWSGNWKFYWREFWPFNAFVMLNVVFINIVSPTKVWGMNFFKKIFSWVVIFFFSH